MLKLFSTQPNKRGYSIQDLVPLVVAFAVVAIVIGLGATVLDNIQDTQTAGTAAHNASADGLASLTTISSYLPTLAIVVIAAVIIGVIVLYFRFR